MTAALRALVIEDNHRVANLVRRALAGERFEVAVVVDGEAGLKTALTADHDLVVLDLRLPGRDGLEIVRTLRERDVWTPVLILTGRRDVTDRVEALQAGADDYLPKPFAVSELLARVDALVRRGTGSRDETTLEVGDLRMDLVRHRVTRGDATIDLSPREFDLLETLMRNPDRAVSRGILFAAAWSDEDRASSNVVDVYIGNLRDKIDRPFDRASIETVRGVGYRLRQPDDEDG